MIWIKLNLLVFVRCIRYRPTCRNTHQT